MRKLTNSLTILAVLLVVGCVVIPDTFDANITVTIRHIQEEADDFLDYVEGKSDTLPGLGAPESQNTSMLDTVRGLFSPIQVAYAQEMKDSSPRIQQIANKMKARYGELQQVKAEGAVGESNRGMLELVKPEKIGDADKTNAVQRLIAAENGDRKALYKEVARLNKDQNLTVTAVERVYAQKRLERARSGELHQMPPAGEDFNAFKSSSKGRALGAQCTPNAWVTIP